MFAYNRVTGNMTIAITGLSHHTSPLALREQMVLKSDGMADTLGRLKARLGAGSSVAILPTCNRLEIYVHAPHPPETLHRQITLFLEEETGLSESVFSRFLYHHADTGAVQHLFRVAASLDSLIVGENEIMGQIQQAYDVAREAGTLDKVLGVLFQRALKCGKRARTDTRISAGKVSVASVAVDLAESIVKDFRGKTVMIVGAGKISELALRNFVERGVRQVMVLNRTVERARSLAVNYQGEALVLDALPCHLHRADIVISSTGASEVILRTSDFERAISRRGSNPMFVMDIAVPRDIEREAAGVENVFCYDLDDLQEGAELNLRRRQGEISACTAIVQKEAESFFDWHQKLHAEPVIVDITRRCHEIRERELNRTLKKLNGVGPNVRHEVECLSRRIINTLLQQPISCMKEEVTGEYKDMLLYFAQRMLGTPSPEGP